MSSVQSQFAFAGEQGRTTATQTITSGTWKVAPSSSIITLGTSLGAPTPQYVTVTNTGTLGLVGSTYSIIIVGVGGGTISLKACSGTWNESTHACTGGSTSTIVSGTTLTSPATANTTTAGQFPDDPSDAIRVQVSGTATVIVAVVVTLTVTVQRSQVRSATTTNS